MAQKEYRYTILLDPDREEGEPFGALPGLSVPCGRSRNGLPLGLMLESAWWREPLLLRAGHAYQQATDWHTMRPMLPGGDGALA